jgi:hypothetical protein
MKHKNIFKIGLLLFMIVAFSYGFINQKKNNNKSFVKHNIAFNNAHNIYDLYPVKENVLDVNIKEFRIDKYTTDNKFLKIMEELKKEDIDIMFNNVERNEDEIITNIEIIVSKQDLSEEFQDSNPNGIAPIIIKISDNNIYVGYELNQNDDFFAFSGNMSDEMEQIKKMMQRQMQILQQMQGSSNNNDIYAKLFGNDMMQDSDKMIQQMMKQMMQDDEAFFNNQGLFSGQNRPKVKTEKKIVKKYIVNGKETSEEEFQKIDKSKIKSLQIFQSQVVTEQYGM